MEQQTSPMPDLPQKRRGKTALIAGGIGAIAVIAGYFILQGQIAENAEDEIARFLRSTDLDRDIRYRDIEASLFGQSVTLRNVRLNMGDASGTIEAVTISNYDLDERSGHLNSIDIHLEGTDFPIQASRSMWLKIQTPMPYLIGVDAVRGNIGIEYQYDNVDGNLDTRINFDLPDLVDGDFEVSLGGIHLPPVDKISSPDFATLGRMFEASGKADLHSVSLKLTDQGVEDAIAEYVSVENGDALDGPAYREKMQQILETRLEKSPPRSPFERHLADIAQDALKSSGGTISIAYEPQFPTPFEDIGSGALNLMLGGFRTFGQQAFQNRETLNDLFESEVLQITFDS